MMPGDQMLDGWLVCIARDGWAGARIDAAAALSGTSTATLAEVWPDRWSALRGFQCSLDRAALAEAGSDPRASIRDRLFAMIMARFDAADAHKPALRQIAATVRRDPGLAAFILADARRSMTSLAEGAGVDTSGLFGPLRVHALGFLLVDPVKTWLDDSDPDLSATMKALDTALARAERLARWTSFRASPAMPGPAGDRQGE